MASRRHGTPARGRSAAGGRPAPAGYSGTPLARKLGIADGFTVALLGAPPRFDAQLAPLPTGVRFARRAAGTADLVLLFVRSATQLVARLPVAIEMLPGGSRLWVAWPKRASGVTTDLTETEVRAAGLDVGWVDHKVCAIDQTWSGLRFARRKA